MNIYKISQAVNSGYDTYDSAVVIAEDENEARKIHPRGDGEITTSNPSPYDDWCSINDVEVEHIGITDSHAKGVVVASFNAG